MTNSQRLAKVRDRLLKWVADHEPTVAGNEPSQNGDEPAILREAILIRDEFFCGRRFYTANHQAVWFLEEDELKIYDDAGDLVCVLVGGEIDTEIDTGQKGDEIESDPPILKLPSVAPAATDAPATGRRAA